MKFDRNGYCSPSLGTRPSSEKPLPIFLTVALLGDGFSSLKSYEEVVERISPIEMTHTQVNLLCYQEWPDRRPGNWVCLFGPGSHRWYKIHQRKSQCHCPHVGCIVFSWSWRRHDLLYVSLGNRRWLLASFGEIILPWEVLGFLRRRFLRQINGLKT